MLFCYTPAALAENWLHECLVEMIVATLDAADAGKPPLKWPNSIPAAYRDQLKTRISLKNAFGNFAAAVSSLSVPERQLLRQALMAQNDFPGNLSSSESCVPLAQLPAAVHVSIKSMAEKAFALLTSLGVRDRHFRLVYDALPDRVCPFCGSEFFEAPSSPRHDLDHYIPISKYPFAGANLRNLSPMGDRCNSAYKGQKDTLVDSAGQRRSSYDPYGSISGSVSLNGTKLFNQFGFEPQWTVDLGPAPEAATWDDVWDIRKRYCRDILTPELDGWLGGFGRWCSETGADLATPVAAALVLQKYIRGLAMQRFADRAFLKKAFFEVVLENVHSDATAERATQFLRGVAFVA